MKKVLRFVMDKETKNTIRYQEKPEEGQPPVMGTTYLQKWALGNEIPQNITVTVDSDPSNDETESEPETKPESKRRR